jgi:Flp pilus assembly protein TadD
MSKHLTTKQLGSICLSLAILLGGWQPTVMAESTSIYTKLGEYERTLFGSADNSEPVEKRLQHIEKQLFGKASKGGNTGERLNAIEKVMSGKAYLPPIAPEMDRSEFAPTPQKAPDNPTVEANQIDRQDDAPLPADNGDRVKGLLRQAMQSYSQGKSTEAERIYQQVLGLDFRNVDANYNLGAIAESKGDLTGAKRYYSTALKGSPGDTDIGDALRAVEQKLQKQEMAKAQAAAQSSSSSNNPPITEADRAIAQQAAESYRKGNFDEAISKLGYLARKNPYDANTQFALGQAYRGKGNSTEALKHLRSAATLDPRNDMYVKALNDAQTQIEDHQTASTPGSYGDNNLASSSAGAGGSSGTGGSNDVTPFTGLPGGNSDDSSGGSGMSAIDNYLRRHGGSGGGMYVGSVSGYGSPGMYGGSSIGGFPMMLGTASGGTRLRRVMTSSLTGAAIGAMTNRGYPGGMSRGAMKGAMYGGLFGLLMGGF